MCPCCIPESEERLLEHGTCLAAQVTRAGLGCSKLGSLRAAWCPTAVRASSRRGSPLLWPDLSWYCQHFTGCPPAGLGREHAAEGTERLSERGAPCCRAEHPSLGASAAGRPGNPHAAPRALQATCAPAFRAAGSARARLSPSRSFLLPHRPPPPCGPAAGRGRRAAARGTGLPSLCAAIATRPRASVV